MFMRGLSGRGGRGLGFDPWKDTSGPFSAPVPAPEVLTAYDGPGEGVWSSPEVIPTDPNAPIESIRNPQNPVRLILMADSAAEVQSVVDNWTPTDGMPTLDVDPAVLANLREQVRNAGEVITAEIDAGRHTPLVVEVLDDSPAGGDPGDDPITGGGDPGDSTVIPISAPLATSPAAAGSLVPGVPNTALYVAGAALLLILLRR